MEIVKKAQPPAGLSRVLFRLPLHLYRRGFGGLFGRRLLVVNHIGRVTGKKRQVVLEVVHYDRTDGSYIVASGWGSAAAWYRALIPHARYAEGPRRVRAVDARRTRSGGP